MSKQTTTIPNDGQWHVLKRGAVCASIEAPNCGSTVEVDITADGTGRVRNRGPAPVEVLYV
jgi:hypothetical protein